MSNRKYGAIVLASAALLAVTGMAATSEPVIWLGWMHEPDYFLLRRGSSGSGGTFGKWLPKCYDRLHSDELMSKAADMGVNLVYAHYFKGFGLCHEHDGMERTRQIVANAHAHGVRVLGYCTFGTIEPETLKDEVPDVERWFCRDAKGNVITYPDQYFRPTPCREERAYLDYIKRVVDYGLDEIGLDGFHFDNGNVHDCHCARCQAGYRAWLAAHVKDPMSVCGLSHFRNVNLPPDDWRTTWNKGLQRDPLALWRDRYRHDAHNAALGDLFAHVRRKGGELIAYNTGLAGDAYRQMGAYCPNAWKADFQFAENRRAIANVNGTNVTQVFAYKLGRRFGVKVFDGTAWRTAGGAVSTSYSRAMIHRFLVQGMIYGNISGASWPLRFMKRGDRMLIDEPGVATAMAEAFSFFRRHAALYAGTPVARTKLLYSPDSCYGWKGYNSESLQDLRRLSGLLDDAALPSVIALDCDIGALKPGETLVLPDLPFARDSQYEALRNAAARGVRIVLTGSYGTYDENGMEREADDPVRGLGGLAGVVRTLPTDEAISLRDAKGAVMPNVLAETALLADGSLVLHLLRVDNEKPLGLLEVAIRDERACSAKDVSLASVDAECRLLGTKAADGVRTVTIDGFTTMATLKF